MKLNRKISLVAGLGYLVIFFSGIYANFFVLEGSLDWNDALLTTQNVRNNLTGFKMGILSFLVMVVADIVLAWALYVLFKPLKPKLALFSAWFRLLNCVLFALALTHLLDVMDLVSNPLYSNYDETQISTEVMRAFKRFNYTWLVGLVLFGVHLIALGILIFSIAKATKIISVLLVIAGFGYLVDSCAQFFLSNYNDYKNYFELAVIAPGLVGELSLTIWLLVRSGKSN